MPYQEPKVRVTEVLDASSVSTGVTEQKTVVIGPAYQIVEDETEPILYDGGTNIYGYSQAGVVDIADPDPLVLPIEQYPVRVFLSDVIVEFIAAATLGGGEHAPVLTASVGASSTIGINDDFIEYTVGEATVIEAAVSVGDFVELSVLPGHWFLVSSIDTDVRKIFFATAPTGGFGAAIAASSLSIATPFVPSSDEPGGSSWTDTQINFDALDVSAISDLLNITQPTRVAGRHDIRVLDADDTSKLTVDGSFANSTREAFGTATLAASTTVSVMTQDPTGLNVPAEKLYLYVADQGAFVEIASTTSSVELELAVAWAGAPGALLDVQVAHIGPRTTALYDIWRNRIGSTVDGITDPVIEIPRAQFAFLQVTVTSTDVTLPSGLLNVGLTIVEAEAHLRYRALDESLKALVEYADSSELQGAFTALDRALVPANPYGWGILKALENSSGRPISGFGVDQTWLSARTTALTEVLDLIEEEDVYALCLADSDPALPQLLKPHVEGQSVPDIGAWRIALFNRRLITEEQVVLPAVTGSGAPEGVSASGLLLTDLTHAVGFVTAGVIVGNLVDITEGTGPTLDDGDAQAGSRAFVDETGALAGVVVGDDLVIEDGADASTHEIVWVDEALKTVYVANVLVGETPKTSTAIASSGGITNPITDTLAVTPVVNSSVTLTGDVTVTAADTGVVGLATVAIITIGLEGPVKDSTALSLSITGGAGLQTIDIDAGNNFTIGAGAITINTAGCSINRSSGKIIIDKTNTTDNTGANWLSTYTGYFAGVTDSDGVVTGAGITSGTVNRDTGAVSVVPKYLLGTPVALTDIDIGYREAVDYHIVHKGAASAVIANQHEISTLSQDVLGLTASALGTITGPLRSVSYEIVKDLTLSEEATAMAGFASGFATRRMVMTWPDILLASVNNVETQVPGWSLSCSIGGMCAGQPAHQGFTRFSVVGYTGRINGKDRFRTTARLNTIAGGGILIVEQDSPGALVKVRHQLTTDVSAILFQELSVTRNVDSIAVALFDTVDPLIGVWNIQEGLFIVMRTRVSGRIQQFIETKSPKIGGQMKIGSKITKLAVNSVQVDTVDVEVDAKVPVPLNNVNLILQASP